jgi:TRAP-type C4-dicarboxylate transport system substrate-binding protein
MTTPHLNWHPPSGIEFDSFVNLASSFMNRPKRKAITLSQWEDESAHLTRREFQRNNNKEEVGFMKRSITTAVLTSLLVGALLAVFSGAASAKTIDLKFSHSFSPMHTMQKKVFEPWGAKLSELTNGQVKVTMFPGGALGKPGDQYALAETGIADIVYILHDYSAGRFHITSVFELPFMTPTAEIASEAMYKTYEKFPQFQKEYAKYKVLALFCHPAGQFHTTKKPIRIIDNFKGIKMRTASPWVTEALKNFGATPVEMPITETYTSLERGVVDGTVVPFEGVGVFKLGDLLKYSTITDFYTVTMAALMNKRKYQSLPPDVKKAIDDNSGLVMSSWCGKEFDAAEKMWKERAIKKGIEMIELSDADKQKLQAQTLPLRALWVEKMKARRLDGKPVLEGALEFLGIE